MAPAVSMLSATAAAAGAASKRPAASDAELPPLDSSSYQQQGDDEAARKGGQQPPPPQQQLECPRCRSTNTKFCYYNNYSTAQPRHFCRACRRYWTHGGTLRDVPVGGATRRASASGGGGGKRRRVSAEPSSSEASPPPPLPAAASSLADGCLPVPDPLTSASFPFLSDGSFFPQFDLGGGVALAPPAAFFSSSLWQSSVVPDFYDGLAPWDNDGATTADADAAAGFVAGAWGDIAGLDLSWTPPGN